jgi:hypothetical protein
MSRNNHILLDRFRYLPLQILLFEDKHGMATGVTWAEYVLQELNHFDIK